MMLVVLICLFAGSFLSTEAVLSRSLRLGELHDRQLTHSLHTTSKSASLFPFDSDIYQFIGCSLILLIIYLLFYAIQFLRYHQFTVS